MPRFASVIITVFLAFFWGTQAAKGQNCASKVLLKTWATKKVLVLGMGAVARTTFPLLMDRFGLKADQLEVLDFVDQTKTLKPWLAKGLKFQQTRITPDNLERELSARLKDGDVLVDLAWNINTWPLINWCHHHGVHYINTSVELWDPLAEGQTLAQRTLRYRYDQLAERMRSWKSKGPTMILEHGANPGLISHFTKQGLVDIANQCLMDGCLPKKKLDQIARALDHRKFNHLAMHLGVKVIHCSERDTQSTSVPKRVGEFVGTWSIEGLEEEGKAPAEMGWGTHEKELPLYGFEHSSGARNQIYLGSNGMNTWVRSWVPDMPIYGMVIRHGEAVSISNHLSVYKNKQLVYGPTVHYAYHPSDATINSLLELRMGGYRGPEAKRILKNEIVSGEDILGALIMGHPYKSWWTGSVLSIDQSRKLAPGENATTLQVAISVVAALDWATAHPNEGVKFPDDLPHDYILQIAKPYLGNFVSKSADWTPLDSPSGLLVPRPWGNALDPWQWSNFWLGPGE